MAIQQNHNYHSFSFSRGQFSCDKFSRGKSLNVPGTETKGPSAWGDLPFPLNIAIISFFISSILHPWTRAISVTPPRNCVRKNWEGCKAGFHGNCRPAGAGLSPGKMQIKWPALIIVERGKKCPSKFSALEFQQFLPRLPRLPCFNASLSRCFGKRGEKPFLSFPMKSF